MKCATATCTPATLLVVVVVAKINGLSMGKKKPVGSSVCDCTYVAIPVLWTKTLSLQFYGITPLKAMTAPTPCVDKTLEKCERIFFRWHFRTATARNWFDTTHL